MTLTGLSIQNLRKVVPKCTNDSIEDWDLILKERMPGVTLENLIKGGSQAYAERGVLQEIVNDKPSWKYWGKNKEWPRKYRVYKTLWPERYTKIVEATWQKTYNYFNI